MPGRWGKEREKGKDDNGKEEEKGKEKEEKESRWRNAIKFVTLDVRDWKLMVTDVAFEEDDLPWLNYHCQEKKKERFIATGNKRKTVIKNDCHPLMRAASRGMKKWQNDNEIKKNEGVDANKSKRKRGRRQFKCHHMKIYRHEEKSWKHNAEGSKRCKKWK